VKLCEQLRDLPNDILIEGHTDSKPFGGRDGYSNWELSTDRANSARRLMEESGLRPGQIVQVRGFADRSLRDKENPESPSNRRVSVIVRYQSPDATAQAEPEKPEAAAKESAAKGVPSKEPPAKEPKH